METTAVQTIENGLQIDKVQEIIGQAPAILEENKQRVSRAMDAADTLLKNKEEVGMSDALDGQMAAFVEKGKKTITAINERRKPFTQMVDMVKKEFTTQESNLKTKVDEVQQVRNAYATKLMEEQRERERIAAERLAKEQEAIALRQQAETKLSNAFNEHLREAKGLLLDKFNGATLQSLPEVALDIAEFNAVLTTETYRTFTPTLAAQYHGQPEIGEILRAAMNALWPGHRDQYASEVTAYKQELRDKKESKRAELEAIEKAGAEEAARLQVEKEAREKAERERIERETREAQEKAEAEAAVQASAATASAMVDTVAEVATAKPEAKEGYEIVLKNVAANLLIAQLWFEHEGKSLSQDKINKVTFDRMRKFCEAHALKTGETIVSPLVEYKPIYKAK